MALSNGPQHDCEQICIDELESYSCDCTDGYSIEMNKCVDFNECQNADMNTCGQNQECFNTDAVF